jgi:eukaryotic-like serine/threonine-protein kinase
VLRPGELIGDWIVEGPLGEGGMGAVYRVHSALTQRLVAALKVMKPSNEPDARTLFIREAEALASLRHPAVVRVMEFAEDDSRGLVYLVMELATGETLRHRTLRGPMNLREAIGIFLPLAQGLDHAHDSGVFHRDIKPSNIVLCDDGTVRLVDFGIAAAHHAEPVTNTGQLGTLAYLPPEVFKAERAEPPAVDVYAFGLLLHEAMTGVRSFPVDPNLTPAAAAAAVGVRKLQAEPMELPERFPDKMRDLVRRATSPDPASRPSMREVRATLETLVERRGAVDATAAHHGRLVPLLPVGTQDDEHTMRVPDPTDKPLAGGPWAGVPRRLLIGGALTALLLGGGAALVARGPDHDPARPAGRRSEPDARSQRAGDPPRYPSPAPVQGGLTATGSASTSPAIPTHSPDASASAPASPPVAAPAPSPAAEGATAEAGGAAPGRAGASPTPQPRLWVSPPPQPVAPTDGTEPEDEIDDDGQTVPVDSGVGGRWELTHEIEATSHAPYSGLRIGYRLNLRQDGDRVYGHGRKYSENGVPLPPGQRTAISVEGRIEGQYLVLDFVEQGAYRSSVGTIRWLMSPGAGAMQGRFASDAAQSSGTSVARRVQ